MFRTGSVILLLVSLSLALASGSKLASPEITGPSGVACAQSGRCAGQSDGVMFASTKTNGFVVCQCECEIERPCPVGTKFDEKQQTCVHVNESGTGGTTGPSGVTCAQRGKCAGRPDGTMFASSKGNGYTVCQCECEIDMPCPVGTKFDEKLQTCDHEGDNGSGGQVSCPSGVTCTKPGKCAGQADGTIFADPKSNGYIVCECECETKKTCPAGSKFDDKLLMCVPETVSCPSGVTCTKPGKCAGQADGTIFADTKSNGYIVCECECEVKKTCPAGSKFDNQLLICVPVNEGGEGSGNGNGNSTNVICKNDVKICNEQPEGTLFPVDEYCDYPQNYNCPWPYQPPSGPTAGPSGIACPNGGRCVRQAEGTMFPSLNSCSKDELFKRFILGSTIFDL
ncbi:hypothetical protein FF38_11151 [Lucilia cuprina]|uniref:Chitin-binding type-2 domain-containing protein n=1 Tax=Lucilia cuprina TaxID=7375 RepID=A0A0L0BXY6_LUCCU|nr:hypothetical protein FF38_11151 [Lucilia cuprina]